MSQQYRYPNSAVVEANINSEGVPGSPIPSEAMMVGGSDGVNLRSLSVSASGVLNVAVSSLPLPSGAATAANQVLEIGELQDIEADIEAMSLKLPASLGAQVSASSLSVVLASDGVLPLPTGAATEATLLSSQVILAAISNKLPALLGQTSSADAFSVVIAADQSPVAIAGRLGVGFDQYDPAQPTIVEEGSDGFGNQIQAMAVYDTAMGQSGSTIDTLTNGSGDIVINDAGTDTQFISVVGTFTGSISATMTLDSAVANLQFRTVGTGTLSSTITAPGLYMLENVIAGYVTLVNNIATGSADVTAIGSVFLKNSGVWARQAGSWTAAATQSGTWNINNISGTVSLPSGAATESTSLAIKDRLPSSLGQAIMANSLAVAIASNQSEIPAVESPAASSSVTSVAGNASNVTLLSSNSSRKFATFFNESTAVLYLKLGSTASTSSYTVQIPSQGYYEMPYRYTGQIDGIWSAANGNVRITELS